MNVATSEEVLDYWFGAPGSPEHGRTRPLWFTKSAQTDAGIRSRFGATVEAALRGDLDGWAGAGSRGALALIIVLDQFTRNVHRDSARAFAGDVRALAVARQMVAAGTDRELPPLQRWFAYMPFEHSEDLVDQRESLRLFGALAQDGLAEPLVWAQKHYDVVERFGRYPHRNELLGRPSTPEEIEFLRQPGSRF